MRRFESGSVGIDHGDVVLFSDFEDDGQMWRGEGPRQSRAEVVFSRAYARPPHVQVSMSMWDISNNTNIRADVQAEDITETGFTIAFRTWSDTQVARVRVAWTSFGELPHDDAALPAFDDIEQGLGHAPLTGRAPGAHHVRGVTQEQGDPLITDGLEEGEEVVVSRVNATAGSQVRPLQSAGPRADEAAPAAAAAATATTAAAQQPAAGEVR